MLQYLVSFASLVSRLFLTAGFFNHHRVVNVGEDAAAVFAHDDFLLFPDFGLPLGRDGVEAAAAGAAPYHYHGQAVDGVAADLVVGLEQPVFDVGGSPVAFS
jgi:hypothetical protein